MEIASAALLEHFQDVIEDGLDCVETDVGEDRFLQLDAADLQSVFIVRFELLSGVGRCVLVAHGELLHDGFDLASFALESFLVFFA